MPLNPPIRDWSGKRIWLIGASTGIGASLAQQWLDLGARVALSARGEAKLSDIAARHDATRSLVLPLDVTAPATLQAAQDKLVAAWGGVDLVMYVAGSHQPIRAWELDAADARHLVETNLMSVVHGLAQVIPLMLAQGHGGIGIVSSVAGYGGLPQSLIYGATKAALINLAETLYLDLKGRGLDVYVINPGFVKTPLTDKNEFKMPMIIEPEEAARQTISQMARGEFEIHYPKGFTRIMKLLRLLPYTAYFALIKRGTRT